MLPILETDRLTLRPMTLDDAADMLAIYSDPRAMQFMPSPPHETIDQTRNMLQWDMAQDGAAMWAITLTGEDRVIGQVHYLGATRVPGMGYIIHHDYWGRGITVEACRPALDHGFSSMGFDRVELWIDETNAASLRVAQKLGFKQRGRIPHKYRHRDQYHFMTIWGMLAREWREDDPAQAPERTRFFGVEPVLMVHDVTATADFYRDKLGFHVDFLYGDPPNHGGVSRGEWTGSLVSLQLSQVPPEREIVPAGYLHVRVDESLDALCETYRANGVEIISRPQDQPWGFREFAIKDLNGHILVIGRFL